MRNKFTIIISDVNGSKHYTLRQVAKKIFIYLILIFTLLFAVSLLWIRVLSHEIEQTSVKKEMYQKRYKELLQQNKNLLDKIEVLNSNIKAKKEELEKINDKIADLEDSIGLKNDINESIDDRINDIKITSFQRKLFFKYIPNGSPVLYKGITAKFGWRIHPILKKKEFHTGVDLRAASGEKIVAPADGIVEFAGFHKISGYGNLIILDHNFGFKTMYGHLKKVSVKAGEYVKKGELIGYVGSTGLSTGHHLHYEVRYIQRVLNPIFFVKWNTKDFDYIFKKERRVKWQSLIKAIQNQIRLLSQQAQK